jgi:hypothetical protein
VTYEAAGIWQYWRHCRQRGFGFVPSTAYTIIHTALRNGSGAAKDPTLGRLLNRPGRGMRQFIEEHRSVLQ